jgi:uncharacterized protein HemY
VRELNASGTRHIHALQMSLKAQQQAKNWPEVLRLVRSLDKHRALHPALSRLRELAYDDLLSDASTMRNRCCASGHRADADRIKPMWPAVPPRTERTRPARRSAAGSGRIAGRRLGRPRACAPTAKAAPAGRPRC